MPQTRSVECQNVLLPFGTNYPPLSGSPTHWTHLNVG